MLIRTQITDIGDPFILKAGDTYYAYVTSLDPEWHWNEAPAVIKHDGTYYLNYSVNCFSSPRVFGGLRGIGFSDGPVQKIRLSRLEKGGRGLFWAGTQ